jgi:hypothetical protein
MSIYRALRRRLLTPDMKATRMDVRGFNVKNDEARERLETIGKFFLTGYAYAAEARTAAEAEHRLEGVPAPYRGFAYEGAGMGFAIREGMPIGGRGLVADFLAGRGDEHVYMVYVGVGWAMARLPRLRWPSLHAPDRLLRWLILDGYGFHQAYFKTDQYVFGQFRGERFPWPADGFRWYAGRVIDQGVGRATWFVAGADPRIVVQIFDRFAPERRPDLYAGAGLAATYAGGVEEEELQWFWDHAGRYRPQVAQGAAFAAGARARAGLTMPHNELATHIFCGMSVEAARKVTDDALEDLPADGYLPSYEAWRQRIADSFIAQGRC